MLPFEDLALTDLLLLLYLLSYRETENTYVSLYQFIDVSCQNTKLKVPLKHLQMIKKDQFLSILICKTNTIV